MAIGAGFAFARLLREEESALTSTLLTQLGSVGSGALNRLTQTGPAQPACTRAKRLLARGEQLVHELESVDRRLSTIEKRLAAIEAGIRATEATSSGSRLSKSKPRPALTPKTPLDAESSSPRKTDGPTNDPGGRRLREGAGPAS